MPDALQLLCHRLVPPAIGEVPKEFSYCASVSIRRACSVLEFDRSTYHYQSRRREQAGLEARIKEICATRVRYGYRRVNVLLRREGWEINLKKTHRIYDELGLQLRNRTPKRRVKAKLRDDRRAACTSNEIWAMDFVHDQLATGQRIRVLTVVDTFSRFSPVIDPRFSYRAEDVVTALEGACASTGYPKTIRVDQGSETQSISLRRGATIAIGAPASRVLATAGAVSGHRPEDVARYRDFFCISRRQSLWGCAPRSPKSLTRSTSIAASIRGSPRNLSRSRRSHQHRQCIRGQRVRQTLPSTAPRSIAQPSHRRRIHPPTQRESTASFRGDAKAHARTPVPL